MKIEKRQEKKKEKREDEDRTKKRKEKKKEKREDEDRKETREKRKKKERMKIEQKRGKITLVNNRSLIFCGNQSTDLIYRYEGSKCPYISTQSNTETCARICTCAHMSLNIPTYINERTNKDKFINMKNTNNKAEQ